MSIYKPTWLYIKQHKITGLKYFGMTRVKHVQSYKGSGKYWRLHLKKHGTDVITIWCQLFDNEDDLIKYATDFSIKNKIVESNEWANLVPETGIYGKSGALKGWKQSESAKRKISLSRKGKPATKGMTGKKHKEESKEKCSKSLSGRKRINFAPFVKDWTIKNLETDQIYTITNLKKWCETNNLNYQVLHRNIKLRKPYKNFIIFEPIS